MKNNTFAADLKQKKYNDQPIGPPEEDDWSNVQKMMEYLKKFYELTHLFSGTKYVVIHLFFAEMCDLFDLISQLEASKDAEISLMASKMRTKVEKYWLEFDVLNPRMNKVICIAAVLDPRQKMRHVERCLKKVYGINRAGELMKEVKELMVEMFDLYKKMFSAATTPLLSSAASPSSTANEDLNEEREDFLGSCSLKIDARSSDDEDDDDISELTIYLVEKYKKGSTPDFDILVWWSKNIIRFPILAEMARDILAIPVPTVTSESAFSTGSRVLDDFRSSLNPSIVEALICTEDWLRSSSTKKLDEEDLPEEEQEQEFLNVLKSIGVGDMQRAEEHVENEERSCSLIVVMNCDDVAWS